MAAPQKFGTTPEIFDGKADKAEAFLSQIENYYYLNEAFFTSEGQRVSAALTHFKANTPAGDWAQDQITAAFARTPRNFGTWDAFVEAFKKHFVPAENQLKSGALMHYYPQGSTPFNEWYQQWSIHASRAGVDENTKMFAFRRNINQALHNKLLIITPQPDTLALLVEKAREFDQLHQMYNSPAFTQNPPARVRAMNIEEEITQHYTPLSEEEKERYIKENLCFYCGIPNHSAKNCRKKKADAQGTQTTIRATTIPDTTDEEDLESLTSGLRISRIHPIPEDAMERPESPQEF